MDFYMGSNCLLLQTAAWNTLCFFIYVNITLDKLHVCSCRTQEYMHLQFAKLLFLLGSYCCCIKLPHTQLLKTTQIISYSIIDQKS